MAGFYCMATSTRPAPCTGTEARRASMEHCNLIDESSVELFVKHKAFMVPTLAPTTAWRPKRGLRAVAEQRSKLREVRDSGLRALELAYKAGVKLAYARTSWVRATATSCGEFALRGAVQKPSTCPLGRRGSAELFNEVGQTRRGGGRGPTCWWWTAIRCATWAVSKIRRRRLRAVIKDGVFLQNKL